LRTPPGNCLPLWPAAFLPFVLAGCGYVGEPLPPALRIPTVVTDLTALERGSNIDIQFTIPKLTTEGLPVPPNADIELRVGTVTGDFQMPEWVANAERVSEIPRDQPIVHVAYPAQKFYGKTVFVAVRVHSPKGRTVSWSNFGIVSVIPALPVPDQVVASDSPDAVHLTWRANAPEFRIFRKTADATQFAQIGSSTTPVYSDSTIEYGKTYDYQVQSVQKTGDNAYAESESSGVMTFKPTDKFPPAVPTGLTAVPGARTVELAWNRNTERDFASYSVYRNGQKIAGGLTAPAFSDAMVQPATTYQYQITAVDSAGNESAKSTPVESAIP
jgi:hypothetical protein